MPNLIKQIPPIYLIGGGALLLLIVAPHLMGKLTGKVAGSVVKGSVTAANEVGVEVVQSLGGVVGLPDTRTAETKTACQKAMDEGNNWAASVNCPASTFLKWEADGVKRNVTGVLNFFGGK